MKKDEQPGKLKELHSHAVTVDGGRVYWRHLAQATVFRCTLRKDALEEEEEEDSMKKMEKQASSPRAHKTGTSRGFSAGRASMFGSPSRH